jgi:FAD synthase
VEIRNISLQSKVDVKLFHLAIGNFDGVHLGHRKLFSLAQKYKKKFNIKIGVLTFEPIPKIFFDKKIKNFRISKFEENGLENVSKAYEAICNYTQSSLRW